ncbi:HIT domain-containing protein [Leptospira gomenensis]|uniref:HIT domain-containing protein n=1 Tax=Leptospira gomenensis TaxID=2484974 RepID=A0A5F1YAQ1_9LEPT|nr:HIT domain-containing protein [Leptospira gomenensis]TGK34472.1 HIT domain-containing protein [Leptospira gomenensis]TGK41858.1 HIT domain-containing protein [Leptospira gomenensis]TGK44795.1 HIT domain-containing protein [Leptospira gomenensis]TGK65182.1 HIT domain-containing protein [Leptospira gomenensis]
MEKPDPDPWEEPRKNLFSIHKLEYARGKRPDVDCILCGICRKDPEVPNLTVSETEHTVVSVNLYPYNPGHLIIFPKRHVLSYEELSDEEALEIHRGTGKAISILKKLWNVQGFNLGYNLGKNSGGSIPHIHQHIVPRFPNEAGFLDVLANSRIVIYEPYEMQKEWIRIWNEFSGS